MRYGLLLLGEHAPDRLLRLARFAEVHDFEHLWYGDEKFFRDPYVSLTYLAQHTERIRLGVCVTDPYTRHPALTATAMGTLDEVAGGRGVLGIGAGFSGLQVLGIRQAKPVVALREAIALIRRLWAGETINMQGPGDCLSRRRVELQGTVRHSYPDCVQWAANFAAGRRSGRRRHARRSRFSPCHCSGAERARRSLSVPT